MNDRTKHGFTLVELLVVIAIIALLAVMLVPMFGDMTARTDNIKCKNNLRRIAEAINQARGDLPQPRQWQEYAVEGGAGKLLVCPADPTDYVDSPPPPDLSDLYLVQGQGNEIRFSNIQVIIDTGRSPEDNQVRRESNAHGVIADPGQALICVGGSCLMTRLTYAGNVKFESLIINAGHGCASTHWLCLDDGRPNWRSHIESTFYNDDHDSSTFLMRFQGVNYNTKWPDYELGHDAASYAMSDAVNVAAPKPGQLMLVEYRKAVAKVRRSGFTVDELGDDNDDEHGCLRTRHRGKANFALTDGTVKDMTRPELQYEYDAYTVIKKNGIWAP